MVNLVWGDHDKSVQVLQDEITGKSRWCDEHDLIFKIDDKFYLTCYRVGSTENCEERPYEFDEDEIECWEVEPYEEVIIKYREKK